jgi:hypothetical protein
MALAYPLLFIVQSVWLLSLGLGVSLYLVDKHHLKKLYAVPAALVVSSLFAYASFWLYLTSTGLGVIFSIVSIVGALVFLIVLYKSTRWRSQLSHPDILLPLALWVVTAFIYSSLTLGCSVTPGISQADSLCHVNGITFDHVLPQLYAENVYSGSSKALMGDWQGSDRPPLLSGFVLLQSPITLLGNIDIVAYQLLATFLQTSWVIVVWLFARKLGLKSKQIVIVLLLCMCSGFFFFNSVFTWPKLLAGTLAAIGLSMLVFEKRTYVFWILGTTAMALALLAHSSVALAYIPIALLLLMKPYFPGWKTVALCLLVAMSILLPWTIYQTFYDPPGDRLLKWGMAGVTSPTDASFTESLSEAYSTIGLSGAVENKLNNIVSLAYNPDTSETLYSKDTTGLLRDLEFRYVLVGLGVLSFGLLTLLIPSIHRKLLKSDLNTKYLRIMFTISLVSLAVWTLAMFNSATMVIHASPYLALILLFICLASLITFLPERLVFIILGFKITYFVLIWIISVYAYHFLQPAFLLWLVPALIALAFILKKALRTNLKALND